MGILIRGIYALTCLLFVLPNQITVSAEKPAPTANNLRRSQADEQPNVVIILADDLGWADVGYHQHGARARVETPNIDRLAAEGIELDRFYVAPMCSPTRAGLLTGRYPLRFGLARAVIPPYRNFGLPPEEQTLAEALANAGYTQRGLFGKWHLGHLQRKWHPLNQGFTHFTGHYNGAIDYFTLERDGQRDWHVNFEPTAAAGYSTDLIADAAIEFIKNHSASPDPFFCYVPFNAPHSPFQAKPDDLKRFGSDGKKQSIEKTLAAMIWSLDQSIGRILTAIDETGESGNTQVWFLSDNGGIGKIRSNNLPLNGNKLSVFEGGIRVPACVRWPAKWKGNRTIENQIGYIDVLPTVWESAGVNLSSAGFAANRPLDGVSLHRLFCGDENELPPRDWYSYHGQSGADSEHIAINTPRWKLIIMGPDLRRHPTGPTDQHEIHLFKIFDDPNETDNVAEQHPDIVKDLFAKLLEHRRLQPDDSVPPYKVGQQNFVAPLDWRIENETK